MPLKRSTVAESPVGIDLELCRQFLERVRARNPGRHLAAARRVDERKAVDVLLVEDEIAGQVGVAMLLDVVAAQARHHVLEIGLVGEAPPVAIDHHGVRAEHFADADDAKQRLLARMLAGDVEAEEHREVVADGARLRAEFGRPSPCRRRRWSAGTSRESPAVPRRPAPSPDWTRRRRRRA